MSERFKNARAYWARPLELDREFEELAQERSRRHPIRTYLIVPISRVATLWLTPRIELLPYSGALWPSSERWEQDPIDYSVTLGFGMLNFAYVGMAMVGAWRFRKNPALIFPIVFVVVRTVFLAQVETPEPRYVLVCVPVVLALGALLWAREKADGRTGQVAVES